MPVVLREQKGGLCSQDGSGVNKVTLKKNSKSPRKNYKRKMDVLHCVGQPSSNGRPAKTINL